MQDCQAMSRRPRVANCKTGARQKFKNDVCKIRSKLETNLHQTAAPVAAQAKHRLRLGWCAPKSCVCVPNFCRFPVWNQCEGPVSSAEKQNLRTSVASKQDLRDPLRSLMVLVGSRLSAFCCLEFELPISTVSPVEWDLTPSRRKAWPLPKVVFQTLEYRFKEGSFKAFKRFAADHNTLSPPQSSKAKALETRSGHRSRSINAIKLIKFDCITEVYKLQKLIGRLAAFRPAQLRTEYSVSRRSI